MEPFQTNKMDLKNKIPIFLFLVLYINKVSGTKVPPPDNLEVNIADGEVVVFWEDPVNAPSESVYNVHMAKYGDQWTEVTSCTKITMTHCDLTSLIKDYSTAYKVRVQLVKEENGSVWIQKRFFPNQSKMLPPSFTLWATSSTLTVHVHDKPILKTLFPFGVTYTMYIEERGQDNKTTTVYLKDDSEVAQRRKTLTGLHWGREYCVSIKVEANAAPFMSHVSDQQCLLLPEQEFYIIAVSSLSLLGVLAVVVIVGTTLLCYLKRPAKKPTALKSPVSGWHPLSVSEEIMEVVTDKGWFLSSYRTNNTLKLPVSYDTVTEDNKEENRKTSFDSGLSIEADSATESEEKPSARQEDSGCGSMGGESSSDSQIDYPLQEDRMDAVEGRKREDSGMGMSCQLDSSSVNLEVPPMKTVSVGSYHRQSPSEVQIQVGDSKDIPTHSILAEMLCGYRPGPQSCICAGAGQCSWCHKYSHFGSEVSNQYRAVCVENRLTDSKSDLTNSFGNKDTFSPYDSKTHMNTVTINDLETTFFQMSETFPLLTSLPLSKCEHDFNMNNVSLSLCDVELLVD